MKNANLSDQRLSLRADFLDKIGSRSPFHLLFDHIPGVFFFAKDAESRMMFASAPLRLRLGVESEEAIVGTTDYDYFPKHVANSFVRDDQRVMESAKPLLNHLEVWYGDHRMLDWFITQKYPVHGLDGTVIGVMGTVQSYEGKKQAMVPHALVAEAVEFIHQRYSDRIGVTEIAEVAGISKRQLQRRFIGVIGVGVKEFLTKTRIQAACNALLHSDADIAQIAFDTGFCDQSAFTLQFRKHVQTTPSVFRRKNRVKKKITR